MLTELEGAILAEIYTRGADTAFQVRKAFATSLSLEWKGSAGSIYPAVKRLQENGYMKASAPKGGRSSRLLSLTDAGRTALMEWACDIKLATSVGLDPFRLRANLWVQLDPKRRRQLFANLRMALSESLPNFEQSLRDTVESEKIRVQMAMDVQHNRLSTLDDWEDRKTATASRSREVRKSKTAKK